MSSRVRSCKLICNTFGNFRFMRNFCSFLNPRHIISKCADSVNLFESGVKQSKTETFFIIHVLVLNILVRSFFLFSEMVGLLDNNLFDFLKFDFVGSKKAQLTVHDNTHTWNSSKLGLVSRIKSNCLNYNEWQIFKLISRLSW